MAGSISLLGSSTAQTTRLKSLNFQMQDLQRQLASQKRHDTFSGFGTQAFRIQDLRAEASRLETYGNNMQHVETRMTLMINAIEKMRDMGGQVQDTIMIQTREGTVNIDDINNVADMNLDFFRDLLNTRDGQRHLFAGSDSHNRPLEDVQSLINTMQNEVTAWLNGSQTPQDLMNHIDALSDTALGFSPTLSSAGPTTAAIDNEVNIDYTAMANEDGFKQMLKGIVLSKVLDFPNPAVDIGTKSEFHDILSYANNLLNSGAQNLETTSFRMGAEFSLLKTVQEQNTAESGMAQTLIAEMENIDPAEVVVSIQSMETRLTASYEVTRIMSEMSLVNFL